MLSREVFDRHMACFQHQYEDKFTSVRKELLYEQIQFLEDKQMMSVTQHALERYNYKNLPSVEQLVSFAKRFEFGNNYRKRYAS